MKKTAASAASPAARRSYSLVILALLYAAFAAASSAPTPLYGLYQHQWGFAAVTLTIVFSAYVLALLGSLLCFGSLSDVLGRKPPILSAIAIEFIALLVFVNARDVTWLIVARAVQGVATGIAFTSLSAAIVDASPGGGALMNSVIPLVALAIGVISSALVVEIVSDVQSVWFVLIGLFLVLAFLTRGVDETVIKARGARVTILPKLRVPPSARISLLAVVPVCCASWALAAFYFSLGPSVVRLMLHTESALVGGGIVAALTLPGAAAVPIARKANLRVASIAATFLLLIGLGITGFSLVHSSLIGLTVGTMLAGAGFGAGFLTGFRRVFIGVGAADRGGLMAAYYVVCYAAFSLPAIAAGYSVGAIGLMSTAYVYGASLIVLSVIALIEALRI